MGFDLRAGGQLRLQAGNNRIHSLQRQDHVGAPVEEQIHFGGTAAGDGLHPAEPGDAVDRFFDGLGDRNEHLVDGHDAVVNANDDAREIRAWKDRHWNLDRQIDSDQCQADQ